MGVDYRFFIIGKSWDEENYSVKSRFWSNRLKGIYDDIDYSIAPKEISNILDDYIKTDLEDSGDLHYRFISIASIDEYINKIKNDIRENEEEIKTLREDRAKSTNSEVFEEFSERIESCNSSIRYLKDECLDSIEFFKAGLLFYISDILDIFSDYYIAVQECW